MKRGLLYRCCRRHGYNKLVLAQHLDDLSESFLMSSFHNGNLRTMKANYSTDSGEDGPPVRVIRPLMYVTRCFRPRHARGRALPRKRADVKRYLKLHLTILPSHAAHTYMHIELCNAVTRAST